MLRRNSLPLPQLHQRVEAVEERLRRGVVPAVAPAEDMEEDPRAPLRRPEDPSAVFSSLKRK